MKNRAIRVSLGIVLVAILAIAWSIARMSAGSVDPAIQGEKSATSRESDRASLDLPLEPASVGSSIGDEPLHTKTELSAPPASALAGTLKLSGVVKDTNGKAIVRYDEFVDGRGDPSDPSSIYSVQIDRHLREPFDEYGRYSFVDLKPGMPDVEVNVPGYRRWWRQIELSKDDRNRRLDIALEPRNVLRLRVVIELENDSPTVQSLRQITGDQDPAEGVLACALLDTEPGEHLECGDDRTGELYYHLRAGEKEGPGDPGTWVVRKALELRDGLPIFAALAVGDRVLRWKRVDSTEEELVFALKAAELRACLGGIRFRVLDEQGQGHALECRCLQIRPAGWEGNGRFWWFPKSRPVGSAASSSEEIRFRCLRPGPLVVRVNIRGYARFHVETVVEPGKDLDLGEIRLKEGFSVRGRVLGIDGTPVHAGLHLETVDVAAKNASTIQQLREDSSADPNGSFAFEGLDRGRYVITAAANYPVLANGAWRPRWVSHSMLVSTEDGSVENLEVRICPTTVVSVETRGLSTSRPMIRIYDREGQFVAQSWLMGSDNGLFSNFFLAEGEYTVRAFAKGEALASTEFVARGERVQVVVGPP